MTVLEPIIAFLFTYSGKIVHLNQVIEGAERPRRPVLRVMDRLVREGYIEEIEDKKIPLGYREGGRARRNPTWRIIKRPLWETFVPRPKRYTTRDKMWRAIRALRRFRKVDIVRLTGCVEGNVTSYISLLVHYGYVRVIGKDGCKRVYHLVKDPGAKRPVTPEITKEDKNECTE